MALGLATTVRANLWLCTPENTSYVPPALYGRPHTASPGVAGATAGATFTFTSLRMSLAPLAA